MKYQITRGEFIEVDTEDIEVLSRHAWHRKQTTYEAIIEDKPIRLRNFLYERKPGHKLVGRRHIKHKNGNKSDYTKANLYLPKVYVKKNRVPKSGFRGVQTVHRAYTHDPKSNKAKHVGYFNSAEEAARFRDKLVSDEYSRGIRTRKPQLNFPEVEHES